MPSTSRSRFGSTRKLPSGHWQARYKHDGIEHIAPKIFGKKTDASAWLAAIQTDLGRGVWIDPRAGQVPLKQYVEVWLDSRTDIRQGTRAKYRYLLDRHIIPALGDVDMVALQPTDVRSWRAKLAKKIPATAAGAYRLLTTICNTAVSDRVIPYSPCKVKGGGSEKASERPTASIAEVNAAGESVPERLRLAVLLASWCQLRRGEILGLQRRDIDELHGQLRVERIFGVHQDGTHAVGPPKTAAGRRTIAIPDNVAPLMSQHLDKYVGPGPEDWLFRGEDGQPVTPRTIDRTWNKARRVIGRPELHLHDLRHSGLTWAAATGATIAELMHRAGHASPAAALRYQHATADRDRALADALSRLASEVPLNLSAKSASPAAEPTISM